MIDLTEKTLSTQEIYSGRVIRVRVDTVSLPDGNESIREIVEHTGAVAVLALDDDNNIVMAHQFRKPLDRVLTEIPAGSLFEGEDPLLCAQRELEEETGFKAEHWEKILSYYSTPGFTNEQLHIYLAKGLSMGQTNPDPDEFIETELVPLDKAYRMIFTGEIADGKSIIAIQYIAAQQLQSPHR